MENENKKQIAKNNQREDVPNNIEERKKISSILEQFGVFTMKQQTSNNGFDISTMDKNQIDKLLDLMSKNEDHAFEYSKIRISSSERIAVKQIDASVIDQKTTRYVTLLGIGVLAAIGLIVLIFKEAYFISFLTFVAGLLGGTGLTSWYKSNSNRINFKPENDDSEEV